MYFPSSFRHHHVRSVRSVTRASIRIDLLLSLVLYFDRIPLWGKFVTTIGVGMLVALVVMFIVKPRLRSSIESERDSVHTKNDIECFVSTFSRFEEETGLRSARRGATAHQERRTLRHLCRYGINLSSCSARPGSFNGAEGRTRLCIAVTGLESVHTADKETQNDYVSMVQDWDMFRQEKPSNDQIRPYGEQGYRCFDSSPPSNLRFS